MKQSAVIIGAGISGLYAATLLEKAGVDYVILEARDRTGGRVLSGLELAGASAGIHVDMGAAWFWPDIQPDFAHLIERLNLPVIAHGRPGDMLYERQLNSPPERYPAWESSPASFRLKGGMQALTAALKSQLPAEKIKTGHQVVAVSRAGKEVLVHTRSEGNKKAVFSGEHVFLALPPALAAKIDFIPAMPEQVLSNWRKIPTWMAPHAKYVAVYKTDLLHERQLSGNAGSRVGPMVEIHDVSEPDSGKTAIFGFIGVPAKSRWTVSEAVLKGLCREQLVRLFGQDAAEPEAEYIKDWAADPFTATEFDLLQEVGHAMPEQLPARGEWSGEMTGIASEWSPQFSGYLAGAIDSASIGVQRWLQQK
ncbi:FAD-dependent oxidoreductase [Enterobacter cloacae subsp. cloacae]|uniref:flavin monoamine oxidase family protein n=1 Tax=Enterobacter cloacae TaxID=550 RepID=UPI001C5B7B6C|nr:FAD-dependent oxidoreductase [Enterobacter cloacae]MBW4204113.1 FAD-dependent oxidoreductase [Enterobacter cloacae subsp. cloacae]